MIYQSMGSGWYLGLEDLSKTASFVLLRIFIELVKNHFTFSEVKPYIQ